MTFQPQQYGVADRAKTFPRLQHFKNEARREDGEYGVGRAGPDECVTRSFQPIKPRQSGHPPPVQFDAATWTSPLLAQIMAGNSARGRIEN
jgi:hypothetical protein